jgi:hypothetical protein
MELVETTRLHIQQRLCRGNFGPKNRSFDDFEPSTGTDCRTAGVHLLGKNLH